MFKAFYQLVHGTRRTAIHASHFRKSFSQQILPQVENSPSFQNFRLCSSHTPFFRKAWQLQPTFCQLERKLRVVPFRTKSDFKMTTKDDIVNFPEHLSFGPNEVIVVTGGSGFLGQHIVRVIQERAEGIKEIRIVDVVAYQKKLEFEEKFPIVFYRGDVCIEEQLDSSFEGATCVIHTAGIVSVGHYVDREHMRSVNVIGTSNVLFKCRQWNISTVVLTSTVDAIVQRNSEFHNVTESVTELPVDEDKFLMGYYGYTKAQAEAQVISARTQKLNNGNPLRTAILRPTVMYGELDPYCIPVAMKVAKSSGGFLGSPAIYFMEEPEYQATYAGNVAWAHLLVAWNLLQEPKQPDAISNGELDGEAFYVTDDTKPVLIYDFLKPFLKLKGFGIRSLPIPLFVISGMLWMINFFVRNLFPVAWKKRLNQYPSIPTYEAFRMGHSQMTFSRKKLKDSVHYKPIYTEREAKTNCAQYYKEVPI